MRVCDKCGREPAVAKLKLRGKNKLTYHYCAECYADVLMVLRVLNK